MDKYHVTDKGKVGKCTAIKGKCPYKEHFDNHQEAFEYSQSRLQNEFDILPDLLEKGKNIDNKISIIDKLKIKLEHYEESNMRSEYMRRLNLAEKIIEERDKIPEINKYFFTSEEVNFNRKEFLTKETKDSNSYYRLINSSKVIEKPDLNFKETFHIRVERRKRIAAMDEFFGQGNTIMFLEISQTKNKSRKVKKKDKHFEKQIVEVRDNGRLIFYGENGNTVTSFITSPSRISLYMKMANVVPSEAFLRKLRMNAVLAKVLKVNERDDEEENKRRREEHKKMLEGRKNRNASSNKSKNKKESTKKETKRKPRDNLDKKKKNSKKSKKNNLDKMIDNFMRNSTGGKRGRGFK